MLTNTELSLRLVSSVVAGAVVGLNRDIHAKPVGVRTLGLVGLGAALVTMAGSGFSANGVDANASRAIQGVVTGIGFLGAGVIVKVGTEAHVRGMTTAAAIWVTAALGIVCGLGAYAAALAAVVLLLLLLVSGGHIDRFIEARWRERCVRKNGKRSASKSDDLSG